MANRKFTSGTGQLRSNTAGKQNGLFTAAKIRSSEKKSSLRSTSFWISQQCGMVVLKLITNLALYSTF